MKGMLKTTSKIVSCLILTAFWSQIAHSKMDIKTGRDSTGRTAYEILGVPETSSLAEIKTKMRTLVMKLHPDISAGNATAEEQIKLINAAYDYLKSEERREAYDKLISQNKHPSVKNAERKNATFKFFGETETWNDEKKIDFT